jgi:hypothetical protein
MFISYSIQHPSSILPDWAPVRKYLKPYSLRRLRIATSFSISEFGFSLEKAVGTTKKTKYTKNQRLTDRVPLTNRVMVTIVLTPSFFMCFVNFVVVICRFKV